MLFCQDQRWCRGALYDQLRAYLPAAEPLAAPTLEQLVWRMEQYTQMTQQQLISLQGNLLNLALICSSLQSDRSELLADQLGVMATPLPPAVPAIDIRARPAVVPLPTLTEAQTARWSLAQQWLSLYHQSRVADYAHNPIVLPFLWGVMAQQNVILFTDRWERVVWYHDDNAATLFLFMENGRELRPVSLQNYDLMMHQEMLYIKKQQNLMTKVAQKLRKGGYAAEELAADKQELIDSYEYGVTHFQYKNEMLYNFTAAFMQRV